MEKKSIASPIHALRAKSGNKEKSLVKMEQMVTAQINCSYLFIYCPDA